MEGSRGLGNRPVCRSCLGLTKVLLRVPLRVLYELLKGLYELLQCLQKGSK